MAASPDKNEPQKTNDKQQKIYNNPFAKRFNTKRDKAPIDQYIKAWIEDIFYYNKKIDIQAKATIYRKLISQKFYELSSCSMVYSIIRQKIKEICYSLRKFINHSYETLNAQSRYLCNIAEEQVGNKKKKAKTDQQTKNIYLPLSKMYVISYRYMCEVAKETFHFWKILYQCTQVKDLRFHSLQTSLNQFILQTFVQPNDAFEPKLMLRSMSFPQKCKFIYAEVEGIKKREQLTHFYEDETVKKLFLKKQDKKDGLIERELAKMRFEFQPQESYPFSKKVESFFHKPRMDYKDIQHLRTYYLQTQQANEEMLFNNLFASIDPSNMTNKVKDITFSQQKLDLIKSLQCSNDKLFEIEDASSEDQIQEHLYYDNQIQSKEQLIDDQDHLQIQLSMNPQKLVQNGQTEGSSKSQPIDQSIQSHDLPMKNYQHEPIPPQFIIPQNISREEHYEYIIQRERAQMQRAIELLTQYSHNDASKSQSQQEQEEAHEDKIAKLKINIARSKEIRNKQKKIQHLDKRQLQEQKEKLQKYRQQLQKQKQQLLRQVQKFMKQKKKETSLMALVKQNKYKNKINRASFKCATNHKIIHKLQKHQQKIQSISLRYDLNSFHDQQQLPSAQFQRIAKIIDDKAKMKQIQQAVAKDLIQNTKLTKKQQKLKKKQDHQAALAQQQCADPKKQKNSLTDQEASLNNFLQRLQIDEDNRVNCNIEQSQIQKWKTRANDFRSGQGNSIPAPSIIQQVIVVKDESNRKKKKNKR